MLTAGPGPGLTNRGQISASHVPRGASLELILASAGPEWVGECARLYNMYMYECLRVCVRSVVAQIALLTVFPMLPGSPRTPARPLCPCRGQQSVSRVSKQFYNKTQLLTPKNFAYSFWAT